MAKKAAEYAETRGIIIADTKFEFGEMPNGEIILIDEVLTPGILFSLTLIKTPRDSGRKRSMPSEEVRIHSINNI
jgi:hypothetical protein